ncbi:MAG: hypothetical protein HY673_03605 [Chloroflexi bacterium]|nr:hypothetical protein [Chloroflexota bacterium]
MIITLEKPAKCADCGSELKVGEKARWYPNGTYGIGCHQNLSDGWKSYAEIARKFKWKVLPEDRDDMESDIILELKELKEKYGPKPLTVGGMMLAAKFLVRDYWRRKSREGQRFTSLNRVVEHQGKPQLSWADTISDARAMDLDAWLDATSRLKALPPGVKKIACKLERGDPLTSGQEAYLRRFREDGKANPNRAWLYKRYQQRRARGLCVRCGEKVEDGFARCPRCREWARMHQALYKRRKGLAWQAKLRQHWRKEGRCPRCGRPPELGHKKCSHCLAKDGECLRRWRKRRAAAAPDCESGTLHICGR